MKKILLLLAVAILMPTTIVAQSFEWQQASALKSVNHRFASPAKLQLAENQKIMGHYDTDDVASPNSGLGLTGLPGVIPIATVISPQELAVFQGGKIVAFRVGIANATTVSRVFVIPVGPAGIPSGLGTKTEWSCNVSAAGWNEIALETPYEINLDESTSLLIGFDYQQTSNNYPISAVNVGDIYPSYCYLLSGRVPQWQDVGLSAYGNLSVQCIVESDSFPDYDLNMSSLVASNYVKAGEMLDFMFKVRNSGVKTVAAGNVSFEVSVDDMKKGEFNNSEAIASQNVRLVGQVETDGLESGTHTLAVTMVALNGEPIENPQTLECEFKVYANSFPRQKHMVEQLTSTYCTYCPLGNSMLSLLTSQRDDVVWVGLHGNLGSGVDPFRSNQCDSIMFYLAGPSISYPSGAFDRSTGWEDDVKIVNGLGYYSQYHQQVADELGNFFDYITASIPTFATISGDFTNEYQTRNATVTISGELTPDFDIMMGEDARLTVYIVEDSLIAPQLNSGTWVAEYLHNGVFRCALGSVEGVALNKTRANQYENSFLFTVPEDWNMKNLRAVAFISRPLKNGGSIFTDMYINNAESVRLVSETGGIEEILTDEDAIPVGYYDVMGRQIDGPRQGINIVKMSNGTAKKVLIR